MAANAPSEGGIKSWFSGDSGVAKFAAELPKVGAAIKGFSDKVTGINVEEVSAASAATRAISALVSNPAESISNMVSLGSNLTSFASRLKSFFGTLKNVTDEDRDRVSTILNSLADISKIDMTGLKTTGDSVRDLSDAMSNILKKSYEKLNNLPTTIQEIGKTTITKLCAGLKAEDRITKLKSACKELAITAYDATNNHIKSVAETIGENLVDGFCNGITKNTYKATAKAQAMAQAAERAAEEELAIKSPSRVFYKIGAFTVRGFTNALSDYGDKTYKASSEMANKAKSGFSDSIRKITSMINNDIDAQPTIRPVLDLSDVRAGTSALSGMFDMSPSVGVLANVGSINSMMNQRSQNGVNDDVVSAIDKLRGALGNVGNTSYNINGVTYDDGSNISAAVETIIRAARIERRV
jgi:hypothetical protein